MAKADGNAVPNGTTGDPAPGTMLGPYRVEALLGRGGMASVFAAVDTRTDAAVALKLTKPVAEPGSHQAARREFRALKRLNHPNVLRVFDRGTWGPRPWFSMERVSGRDLAAEVTAWQSLSASDRFARAQAVLVQLARALDHVHERGLVHRDLTPGNVLIQPDGVVRLTDFGVVRDVTDVGAELAVQGTAAWIAPEQALSQPVDGRTDLYCLGGLLYLMLTGRRPFTARTVQGYIDKHVHEVPRPPIEVDPRVPEHLDQVARRLLQKRPADRFASASHLLHVLGDVDPIDDSEHWPPRLVGRANLRARVRGLLDDLANGKPGNVVLIQGAPGQGKTRILDVAESQARRRGLTVARGASRSADGPFGSFVSVLQDLAPPEVPDVVRAALLAEGDAPTERYRVQAAFRPLVSAASPAVIILDDLHLADGASLALLQYLIRNTLELAEEQVLYVLGEEISADGPTRLEQHLPDAIVHERLGPLAQSEVEELLMSLVGDAAASEALARRLHLETGGSPAYLTDMLRGLADEGLLVQEGNRWRVTLETEAITRSRLPMPASLRQALTERLGPLGPDALDVGRALAVARRPVEFDVLLQASPLDEDRTSEAIDALREAGIVQEDREDQVELSHQRFRDVLLEGLDDAGRARAHQRLGEVLERHHRRRPGRVVEELTFHFTEAAIATKAFAYLRRTAQRRMDASLWAEALAFLDKALAMEAEVRPMLLLDDADRAIAEIRLGRSKCLCALGRSREAAREGEAAAAIAREVDDPALESRALVELGRQQRTRGDLDAARPHVERALERAKAAHDPSLRPEPLYQLGALEWADHQLDTAESHFRAGLETAQRIGDETAIGFAYNGLGILALCSGQTMEARRFLEQSADRFDRLGLLAPLSIARTNLAELYHATGLLKKALALVDRTVAQAREVHHPVGHALGLARRARVLAVLGRGEEALQNAAEALRLTVEVRSPEDELLARATMARIACWERRYELAVEVATPLDALLPGADTEGLAPQALGWRAVAFAHLGKAAEAMADIDAADPSEAWPHVRVPAELARAEANIALGRRELARVALASALHLSEANGYRLYQLKAHHNLARIVTDEATRARHSRVASALARSLAASLSRADAGRFLTRDWGL